jgi:hypothetical protein
MDPLMVASRLVDARFPDAVGAWLTGSYARGQATASSDVDILVVRAHGEAFRETFRVDDALVELFVHSEQTLTEWYELEAAEFRCGLAHMLAESVLITSRSNDQRAQQVQPQQVQPQQVQPQQPQPQQLQQGAAALVSAGPPERTRDQVDALRYHLTASVDDLVGAADDERCFVGIEAVRLASELELAVRRAWTGRGRWLHRWLQVASPDVARRLAEAIDELPTEAATLHSVAQDVLTSAGGRLQEGYRVG